MKDKSIADVLSASLNSIISENKEELLDHFLESYKEDIFKRISETSRELISYYFQQHKHDVNLRVTELINKAVDDNFSKQISKMVLDILEQDKCIQVISDRIDYFMEVGVDTFVNKSVRDKVEALIKKKKIKVNLS